MAFRKFCMTPYVQWSYLSDSEDAYHQKELLYKDKTHSDPLNIDSG